MKKKVDYLKYVEDILKNIPKGVAKASYNTGYGIHIVSDDLGYSPMTLFVVQHSLAKVEVPKCESDEEWDECWNEAKTMINEFVSKESLGV